jgi:microcystin-dependent protein
MDEPYLAMICVFGFNFAPTGWALCNGALLSIAQNSAVFSLVGVTYGGNGQTTFAIPDLRGRVPVGIGQSPGLSQYDWGQMGGVESVTLTTSQIPMHTHAMTHTLTAAPKASTQAATSNVPAAINVPAALPTIGAGVNTFTVNGYNTAPDVTLLPADVSGSIVAGVSGGSQPHSILQPYLAVNYCLAMQGIYPSRS